MNDRLTQSDIDKMQKEIEHRKLVLRKQLLEDVKEARSHGDLSENFEYYAAKKPKTRTNPVSVIWSEWLRRRILLRTIQRTMRLV